MTVSLMHVEFLESNLAVLIRRISQPQLFIFLRKEPRLVHLLLQTMLFLDINIL
jgi:hypothetical protein